MKTKTFLKIVAAIAIVCLPVLAASCGSDDKGPVTYEYNWDITGFTIPNDNDSIATSWMLARQQVSKLLAQAIAAKGFVVNVNEKEFSIALDPEMSITPYDDKAQMAVLEVKNTTAFLAEADKLPSSARIVVKRGKTEIINRSLK